jgi:protein N-terminal asparagine amidohydrolase
MVLVVGGVVLQEEIPADSRSLYAAHPVYRESAIQLHSMPAKLVGPVGLLYVQQREMAATLPHDSKYNGISNELLFATRSLK